MVRFVGLHPGGSGRWRLLATGCVAVAVLGLVLSGSALATGTTTPTLSTTIRVADSDGQEVTGPEPLGSEVFDTAVLGNTVSGTPTGTVTYNLFEFSCPSFPVWGEPVPLNADGSVPNSANTPPLAAGSYAFRASYSGDANYRSATGGCEVFKIAPAQPRVTTTVENAADGKPVSGALAPGSTVYDSAAIGPTVPGFRPSGTVAYQFFHNGSCGGTPVAAGNVGVGDPSANEGPLAAGRYSFEAEYNGDSNYRPATGACEAFVVGNRSP